MSQLLSTRILSILQLTDVDSDAVDLLRTLSTYFCQSPAASNLKLGVCHPIRPTDEEHVIKLALHDVESAWEGWFLHQRKGMKLRY